MGMDMSEVLACASRYLHQLNGIEGKYGIEVPSTLLNALKEASVEATVELESKISLNPTSRIA